MDVGDWRGELAALGQLVRFRAMGDWGVDQVKCARAESTFNPPMSVRAEIESVWEMMGRRPGVHLFDGEMCRLESFEAGVDELKLVWSKTSYKDFAGTNMHNPQFAAEHGAAAMANPIGMSAALVSADGFLLMGKRNERVAYYPGRIHPFAGAMEPEDRGDVFWAVERELAEEMAVEMGQIVGMRCVGIAEDRGLAQPELIFYVEVTKTAGELREKLDRGEHEG